MANAGSLHREMFEAVTKRDWDGLRSLCHADYVYMDATGVEEKGADAAVAVAQTYTTAFPDLVLDTRHQYTDGDNASVLEFTVRGTHEAELAGIPATGKRIELVVCNVIEVKDGKIVREREYYDNLTLMQQLGVAPG